MSIFAKNIRGFIFVMGCGLVTLTSCKSTKKIQQASPTVIAPKKNVVTEVDSAALATNAWKKAAAQQLNFSTLKAKASASIASSFLDNSVTLNLRMQKDKIIWISLTGPFGIEGARVYITPDSLFVNNKLQKKLDRYPFSYLEKMSKLPFTFTDLQNLLIGGSIFANDAAKESKFAEGFWSFLFKKNGLINKVQLDRDNRYSSFFLTDSLHSGYKSTINNKNFVVLNGFQFPTERRIEIQGKQAMTLNLSFKQQEVNQPLDFPFSF